MTELTKTNEDLCKNDILAHAKQMEIEKVHETDDFLQVLLDATPLGVHIWDKNGHVVDCNQASAVLFNLSCKQEFLKRFFEFSPEFQPDGSPSKEAAVQHVQKAFHEGYLRFEWMHCTLDGKPVPCEVTLVRVVYKNDHLVAVYIRDLREQKQREMELVRAHEQNALQLAKLNLVIKAAKIGLWDMNVRADDPVNPVNPIMWSDEFRHLLGFSNEHDFPNVISSLHDCMHPDDLLRVPVAFTKHLFDTTGKTPYDIEYRLKRKNGKYAYFHATGETVRDKNGNPLRVAGALMDITDIKNTLRNNEIQLTKMNLMIKGSGMGLWDMEVVQDDPVNRNNVFMWSDDLRHMLGFTDENDFPNVLGSLLDRLHPDDRKELRKAFMKHLMDKAGKTPFITEHRVMKKNGEYVYLRTTGETIRDKDGNALHVAGAILDITEMKNLINEAEQQRLAADAANKAKSAFLSMMSHEIRTPMNAILGIADIQLQDESCDHNVRDILEKIHASGDVLLGIINDILDFSKIEAGKLELVIAPYQIASLVSDAALLNMMRICSKPIQFELCVAEGMPANFLGDELRIKQILNNVLSNAFKYTEEGTVKLSVTAESVQNGKNTVMLNFTVSDTGQGMTQEQIGKLFDEYIRFNMTTNRSTEGTGLGMSITQKLVRLMDGEIHVESELGKGSVFTVRLPQVKTGTEVVSKEMVKNLQQFRTNSRAQMKRMQITREPMPYGSVLIVDDVETNIYVVKGLLAAYALKIDSAESGFEAIEKISQGNLYDIIFMDHMMPKMDGMETTKIMRNMGYDRPIVALTANAVSGQAAIFLQNGFDDFISKPIDIRQLNSVLNRLIRDKHQPETIQATRQSAQNNNQTFDRASPPSINPQFAPFFLRDATKALAALEPIIEKNDYENEANMQTYVITVHGMKSATAFLGRTDLSALASKLETAGQERNIQVIMSETPAFVRSLKILVEEISLQKNHADKKMSEEVESQLHEKLLLIKLACEEYDEHAANKVMEELNQTTWHKHERELLNKIALHLLHSDLDEVVAVVDHETASRKPKT